MKNAKMFFCIIIVVLGFADSLEAASKEDTIPAIKSRAERIRQRQDSIRRMQDLKVFSLADKLDWENVSRSPFISIQQFLKGNISGVYVQENTGEPGNIQSMLVRGLSSPIFSNRDVSGTQPIVFLNGLPLLLTDSYLYGVKSMDVNPIGTATNALTGINMSAVQSIEVVKDAVELAKLGPLAANGAILINLKDGYYGGSNVFIRANGGMNFAPGKVTMTNAANERDFRMQFADLCQNDKQRMDYLHQMPEWMLDLRDYNFFGKPDWADDYYRMSPLYNLGTTLAGGGSNANYTFTAEYVGDAGVADDTNFGKFSASFALNMTLIDRLEISCLINGTRINRTRNRNLRDRYAEIEYMPDLSIPLSPTKDSYTSYLDYYDEYKKDDNLNNMVNGYFSAHYNWKNLYVDTRLLMDYNTNVRHVFWPTGLMEDVNFVSDYSGYNRRLMWQSTARYNFNMQNKHFAGLEFQEIIQKDLQHYNYSKAYDGVDDQKPTTSSGGFRFISRYSDKMVNNMISSLLSLKYRYSNLFEAKALLRYDGSSAIQQDNRWLFSPAFSLSWNLKNNFLTHKEFLSDWALRVSWARVGRFMDSNRLAAGPQYTGEELTGLGQPVTSSFYGYASIARPYNTGWVGYGLGWPYSDKWNAGMMVSLFKDRLRFGVEYYNNTDCDLITAIPVVQEYGYKYKYLNGMKIRNRGVEFNVSGKILEHPKGLNWNTSFAMAYNKNKLCKLPGGYDELVINNRKLKVGHSIDEFWVYQNNGIYATDAEVPQINGQRLSMDGIQFSKGDPKWVDQNGDNAITEDDKVMKGHMLPVITGNFENTFTLGRFDLGFNFFFAAGHDAINYRSSQRYNFLNLENKASLESVKEIFFWQNTNNNDNYPIYNQMSHLTPYRADQDLFMEKLNFLKLRSLTLGYTLPLKKKTKTIDIVAETGKKKNKKKGKSKSTAKTQIDNIYFYVTANNLFTLSNFSGNDPELVDFDGYYRAYGQPIPRSVVVGLKFNF